MGRALIVPATALPVTLAQAKKSLRIEADSTDMDDLVTLWLLGIVRDLEHQIGQAVMPQEWLVTADWLYPAIDLPHPVRSVLSVSFLDEAGTRRTLDPVTYQLVVSELESTLAAAPGSTWPSGRDVRVSVFCGYGEDPEDVPPNIRLYVLAKLAEQYDPETKSDRGTVQSKFIDGLLDACRTYR